MAETNANQAILISHDIEENSDTAIIEMATEDKEIKGSLHNTCQGLFLKFTKTTSAGNTGILTLSGNNSNLTDVSFGDITGSSENVPLLSPYTTLNVYGSKINGKIKAGANSVINIGGLLQ